MEESSWCPSCRAQTAHFDLVDCTNVCEVCGHVQEASSLVSGDYEGGGTRVEDVSGASAAWRLLDSSRAGRLIQQEAFKKRSVGRPQTLQRLVQIADQVHLPACYRTDAESLIDLVLQGEWGQGRWLDILIAACVYIVIRQKRLALTIADVASAVQSNPVEVGATFRKVLQLLHIQLPEADPMAFIHSALSRLLQGRQSSKRAILIEHSELLLICARNACLTTGRRPLPLTAAILFQAAEGNQVKLTLEQVSHTLGAGSATALTRLRELRAALVAEGQKLPWGKDVSESNVNQHLPMLLQLLRLAPKGDSEERDGESAGQSTRQLTQKLDGRNFRSIIDSSGGEGGTAAGPGEKSGLSDKGSSGLQRSKKRKSDDLGAAREGTPENMAMGPLGSYLEVKRARSNMQEDDAAKASSDISGREKDNHTFDESSGQERIVSDEGRASVTHNRSGFIKTKERQEESEPSVVCGQGKAEASRAADLHTASRLHSAELASKATDSLVQTDRNFEAKMPAPGLAMRSREVPRSVQNIRVGLRTATASVPEKGQKLGDSAGSHCRERKEKDSPTVLVEQIGAAEVPKCTNLPELPSDKASLQDPAHGAEQDKTVLEAEALVPGNEDMRVAESLQAHTIELHERRDKVRAVLLNGTPPSFQAQAIERQRRLLLIGHIKQRLSSRYSHLGVNGQKHPPSLAAPLAPLPKLSKAATKPQCVLLAPKKKRRAAGDPEWEAKIVEALLLRGADERLLVEGKYEQARLQLEATTLRDEALDEDVSEYIKSTAEVRLLHATRNFLASPKKG